MKQGGLSIVGTGITLIAQLTAEAQAYITSADRVFYLIPHSLADDWMRQLNPRSESLAAHYQPGRERSTVYMAICAQVLTAVRAGERVCVAFYGHPQVFVTPTADLIRQARAAGMPVTVLPGISAADCLFADLSLDPGVQGCQSYEASDFLLRPRRFDPTTPLILWQVGVIGYFAVVDAATDPAPGLALLSAVLQRSYPAEHELILYQAAVLPIHTPQITPVRLEQLAQASTTSLATLYVPPLAAPAVDPHIAAQFGTPA
jgi:uncharacterized protein YabN with tetrapyrrole methylase and pyrophosphatase domain